MALRIGNIEIIPPDQVPQCPAENCAGYYIGWGIDLALVGIIILSIIFIIVGGISWIISEGEKTKLAKARQTVIYALLGLVVALSAFFVVNTVGSFFSVRLVG